MRHEVIGKLYPNVVNQVNNKAFDANGNKIVVDEDVIAEEVSKLLAEVPMKRLREERNQKLVESDWTQNRDLTLSNDSEWKTYRQVLRDLPSTASPTLNEHGQLTNVTWPTKPE